MSTLAGTLESEAIGTFDAIQGADNIDHVVLRSKPRAEISSEYPYMDRCV
ncbi:MAG: hypothetical protein U0936_11335 [Planctomycetaceae bacterium]